MTDQLNALKELAEKVEVGNSSNGAKAYWAFQLDSGGLRNYFMAYHGSLDAAHALHKAVLGDRWEWVMTSDTVDVWRLNSSAMLMADTICQGKSDASPARAWLLAIIKAKITELEQ